MNKQQELIMLSDLEYQKRLNDMNVKLVVNLSARIQRVRELHELVTQNNAACGDPDCCGEYEEEEVCADCQCEYPCPTIKALDGEISE